jgi:hypothetical protein
MDSRRSKFAVGLIGVLGLAGMPACNSTEPLPFAQFESSDQEALCHGHVLCGTFPDQATCLASIQVAPHYYDTLSQDVESGKVVYDGGKARECFDKVNALSSCNRLGFPVIKSDPTCTTIFAGTVAVGGACLFPEECLGGACQQSDASCASSTQCCPGTCIAVPPPVASGSPCPPPPANCASGICVLAADGTATCRTPVGLGLLCGVDVPCASGLYCDPATGICKAPVGAGGACNPALDSEDCDVPDTCDTTTSVCTPPLPVGAACDPSTGGCMSYASCDATTDSCVERPQVGAPCDPTGAGPACLGGSCDATSTTCTLEPTAGACS